MSDGFKIFLITLPITWMVIGAIMEALTHSPKAKSEEQKNLENKIALVFLFASIAYISAALLGIL